MSVILCIVVVMWCTLTVECLCLICAFYCYCWHVMYIVVTCPELCNCDSGDANNKKCLHFPHRFNYVTTFMHNLWAKSVIPIH